MNVPVIAPLGPEYLISCCIAGECCVVGKEVPNATFDVFWMEQTRAAYGAAVCETRCVLTLWVSFLVGVASVDKTGGRVQLVLQLHVEPSSLAECVPRS